MKNLFLGLGLLSLVSCSTLKSFKVKGEKYKRANFTSSWIKNLDPEYHTGNLPIGLASPLVHDGLVYAGSADGYFYAYELEKGRLMWREKINGGMNSAPIVYDDLLIYGDISGRVYAKNLSNDKFEYMFDLGSSVDSTPVVANGRLLVHTRNHKVFCLDAKTGKILWSYRRSVPFFSTLQRTSRPLVVKSRVYIGFADGYLLSFSLEDGQVLWEKRMSAKDRFVDVDMSPAYFNKKLVVSSIHDNAEIINPDTGVLVKRLSFSTNRDAVMMGDKIFLGSTDGGLKALDDNFNIVRDIKLSKNPISSITKWKEGLVVTTIGSEVFYLNKGLEVVETFDLGAKFSAVFGNTSTDEGALAILSSRNRLYLFK